MKPFVRIQIRHFPSSSELSINWKEQANIFEFLRIMGHEEEFLSTLCLNDDFEASLEALYILHTTAKEQIDTSLKVNHFNEQILKDLKDGPFQYGVRASPTILINLELENGTLDEKSIKAHIQCLLLKNSL
jgi:hypothetical protein